MLLKCLNEHNREYSLIINSMIIPFNIQNTRGGFRHRFRALCSH